MKILVTGGAGFIGSHVVDLLVELGVEVRVLDALHPAAHSHAPDYLNERAEYAWGDLQDQDLVRRAISRVDAVSHQAAMVGLGADLGDLPAYVRHNDLGTAILLREMARARFQGRLVLGSSMSVYGEGAYRCPRHGTVRGEPRRAALLRRGRFDPPCPRCGRTLAPEAVAETASLDPRSVYAATKLHQEHLCAAFARETGSAFTALRYHNVYGPRMPAETPYAGVASVFRSALERGQRPELFEDGRQLRDFVHVRDVARANVLALTSDPPVGGPLNVATGRPRSVGEMAEALCESFGASIRPLVTGRYRLGDVRHVFGSAACAQQALGFRAEVEFMDGMREFASAPLRDPARSQDATVTLTR